jgi:hypothetical protein
MLGLQRSTSKKKWIILFIFILITVMSISNDETNNVNILVIVPASDRSYVIHASYPVLLFL